MVNPKLDDVIYLLDELKEDESISKKLRTTIFNVLKILDEEDDIKLMCDRALQELEKVGNDQSMDPCTNSALLNIVSQLQQISNE